jgi:CO/xanthine dehydrogenase Mo-binding subunit
MAGRQQFMNAQIIGASARRKEDFRFLTGAGNYTDEINRPDQLYAYILRSPHAHAEIARIQTGTATSSVFTVKPVSVFGPKVVVIATSAASRPRASKIRPIRGVLWRASKVYHASPR